MQSKPLIAPSILAADYADLGAEVRAVAEAGADWIHLDVMDGHFVPNISFGPALIKALRGQTDKIFDVHLMIAPVDPFVAEFVEAGADIITVHAEAGPHLHRTIQLVRSHGIKAGVAINPGTPLAAVKPVLGDVDLILAMSVNPGFGGQAFIPSALDRLRELRRMIQESGRDIHLEVDGGINFETAPQAAAAGADVLVAGTATFKGGRARYAANIEALRSGAAGSEKAGRRSA